MYTEFALTEAIVEKKEKIAQKSLTRKPIMKFKCGWKKI